MPSRQVPVRLLAAATVAAVLLSGCAADATAQVPAPESTVAASDAIAHPPAGYRVAVISRTDDATASVLLSGVDAWAEREGVTVQELPVDDPDAVEAAIESTVADAPDLVIGVGEGVVDVFSLITAQHLGQQFLVVGAQLAEPTENVTAAIWEGAAFRGTGITDPGAQDAEAVTPRRAEEAVAAGVSSVLNGVTGVVVLLG